MNNIIAFESIVILNTFQGLTKAPENISEDENYWKLIGAKGKVISENQKIHPAYPEKGKRALVQFNEDINALGLSCHNEVSNSLWVFVTDLKLL